MKYSDKTSNLLYYICDDEWQEWTYKDPGTTM